VAAIDTQFLLLYVYFQNGAAELVIKRIQMIARPMLMMLQLPTSAWGHAVLHAASLLKYRPFAFNQHTSHHLAFGPPPNISHLLTFGCQVLVPILGPKCTKMGPQRRKGIYIGYDSPPIIRFMEPATRDIFKARFQDCHFFEDIFPGLDTAVESNPLQWQSQNLFWNDPPTKLADIEV
jgi:hypothetical protein